MVAINKFDTDSAEEIKAIFDKCNELGVKVALNEGWGKGGDGAIDLAKTVVEATENPANQFKPLYDMDWDIETKVKTIATKLYGASDVEFSAQARKDLKLIDELGLSKLAVCIAKTQKSLSDNPLLKGRPTQFIVNIREIEIAAGAGFVVPIAGEIMRMPGLPDVPAAESIDIDEDGNITGLF